MAQARVGISLRRKTDILSVGGQVAVAIATYGPNIHSISRYTLAVAPMSFRALGAPMSFLQCCAAAVV